MPIPQSFDHGIGIALIDLFSLYRVARFTISARRAPPKSILSNTFRGLVLIRTSLRYDSSTSSIFFGYGLRTGEMVCMRYTVNGFTGTNAFVVVSVCVGVATIHVLH